ncbi:hypothetical protein TNCV_1281911 [Trichonephila clavipes]|uniref:Uncharacterized protein n=1 Tax=Trichonephila clavipes TaxID=2585209 RepID=A0A8X6SZB4_TRICX|nr:hypothetical protein TNCV_1281911 [Trichonephila clavipes]
MPRAHQAGLSRRSLAGVGLSESSTAGLQRLGFTPNVKSSELIAFRYVGLKTSVAVTTEMEGMRSVLFSDELKCIRQSDSRRESLWGSPGKKMKFTFIALM